MQIQTNNKNFIRPKGKRYVTSQIYRCDAHERVEAFAKLIFSAIKDVELRSDPSSNSVVRRRCRSYPIGTAARGLVHLKALAEW